MNNGQGLITMPGNGIDKDRQLRGHFETKRARLEAGGQEIGGRLTAKLWGLHLDPPLAGNPCLGLR